MIRAEIQPGVWLDSRRAVFFEQPSLLVASDLHWGYAASHRARGNLLPDWGDHEITRDLNALVADYRPAEMLWLGDSLHTLSGRAGAERFLTEATVPVTILPGNHDARWAAVGRERLVVRGGFAFHHGDMPPGPELASGLVEVIGHHHPAFNWWDGAGARLKLPALVWSERRMILPAFSPWAAGAPWNQNLRKKERLWAVAPRRVFAVTEAGLRGGGGGARR